MQRPNRTLLIVLIAAALLICCYCAIVGGVGALVLNPFRSSGRPQVSITRVVTRIATSERSIFATLTPAPSRTPAPDAKVVESTPAGETATPVPGAASPAPTAATTAAAPELANSAEETAILAAAEMPAADPRVLAMELKPNAGNIPEVVRTTPPEYKVGDERKFWVSNQDTQDYRVISAGLKYMTDVVAIWVEDGVSFSQSDMQASADRFTEKTYPKDREFFGSEWKPGVDGDPRLQILYARSLGENVAGYYSSADEYSQKVNQYSNEREMFYISADSTNDKPNTTYFDGTLAHEFQHMIHWNNDRNEDSWVNEGMSELAADLNGYDVGGADVAYAQRPDTQLTTWSDPSIGNTEHYGGSYLFMRYFLDRFGEDLMKAVVASPKNGIAGFNDALEKAGRPERFDDIYADWVVANYLDAPEADASGRYGYKTIDPFPMAISEEYSRYPASAKAQVSQYGVDYIKLDGKQPVTIHFEGQPQTQLVNATPQGKYSWWSNRGDQSDSTLTRTIDLRNAKAPKLEFSAWYDIEKDYDYAYVEASTDGGKTWQILPGKYSSTENTIGNSFGPGWTGISGGGDQAQWVDEAVDLSAYEGKEILLRFEMVTDDAVNHPGLLVDNLRIPEIGWQDDVESGTNGWTSAGWLRTDDSVQQGWLVQLLEIGNGTLTVERMEVGPDGTGDITIENMKDLDEVTMTVSAIAPVTTEKASYSYSISPK
jgi:immune inhibitor A